jgi:hypothetical protein
MGFFRDYWDTHPEDLLRIVNFFYIMWVFEKRKEKKNEILANQFLCSANLQFRMLIITLFSISFSRNILDCTSKNTTINIHDWKFSLFVTFYYFYSSILIFILQ